MLKLGEKSLEIRKRRKLLGLTQKELASISLVSQSLVAKLESGKIDPSYSSMEKIDSALNDLEKLNLKKEIKAGDIMNYPVVQISEDEKINKVIKIMWNKGFSQLPVFDGNVSVGSVSEEDILKAHGDYGSKLKKLQIKEIMNESFPMVNKNTNINSIRELLKENKAVLVLGSRKIQGIITKSDFLKA